MTASKKAVAKASKRKIATPTRKSSAKASSSLGLSGLGKSSAQITRLSDPSMSKSLDTLSARIKSDPQYALKLLRKAGIATKTGRLTKRHGG